MVGVKGRWLSPHPGGVTARAVTSSKEAEAETAVARWLSPHSLVITSIPRVEEEEEVGCAWLGLGFGFRGRGQGLGSVVRVGVGVRVGGKVRGTRGRVRLVRVIAEGRVAALAGCHP